MVDISVPHCCCPTSDVRFSLLPMRPITSPATGSSTNTKIVSCQLITIIMPRHTTIIIGFLNIISSDAMMEFSTSATSPDIRAITSPLRSLEKKPMGRPRILS